MTKLWKILFIGLLISFAAGCSSASSSKESTETPVIYTTIYPLQYIVDRLTGSTIDVESVYPPGADAHTYEPTAKEMTEIAEADAFIFLGGDMETFSETTAQAVEKEDVKLIEISEYESLFAEAVTETDHQANGAEEAEHEGHDHTEEEAGHEGHDHSTHDSHIWLDPVRMKELTSILEKELAEMFPENKAVIQQEAKELINELDGLNHDFQETIVSKEKKQILVSHAAYGYWEQRYGIEQLAINGLSSSSEPSQQDLIQIIETAEKLDMQYVIFEQNLSNSVSEKIRQEIGAESLTLHNLEVLTEEDRENNQDYFSLMYQNLDVLETALSN